MKKILTMLLALVMVFSVMCVGASALDLTTGSYEGWDSETKTLTLTNAELAEGVTLPDGATVIVNGDCSIAAGDANAIESEGAVTVTGGGKLTLAGANGIMATSVAIEGIDVDFNATSCGIQVFNDAGDAKVTLTGVDGSITGGYAGIYVNGECAETSASVTVTGCDLDVTSTATSYNNRARKSGITVYVSKAEKVESSITITDSNVTAIGADAGLAINNYLGDADATNSASSKINITNSTVVAEGTNGTWSGIFASVLGQHPDADSIITIKDSSVYAVSPNTGILTSSQRGESGIVLDNSILGASGKTALSMIEPESQKQTAELKNGSTYVQMTPDAVMKGEIVNHDGKTIIAAEQAITYNTEGNYYVIPQGSVVTEKFTDGTENTYTFNKQAGGVGGFDYAKEEIWGYDVPEKWETGDIIIYTPEELIEFATKTQDGSLGNCEGRTVKLGADIDMTGYDWYYRNAEGTIVTDHRIPDFIGTFDGQGYTIKNMSYRDEYAAATEMNNLAFIIQGKSFLNDLTIDGITVNTVAPAYFAGLVKDYAWSGSDEGTVENCSVKNIAVNSSADLTFGGMFYRLVGGKAINNCHVENFTVNAGGALVGDNSGRNGGFVATGGEPMTMTDCSVTNLVVNAESTGKYLGGFIGGASMTAGFDNCDVTGFELNAKGKFSAVGGFMGYTAGSAWGEGMIVEDCDVKGLDIETTDKIGVGAGGFIGNLYGQGKSIEDGAHHFINCTTAGTISGDAYAGGFAGWLYGRSNGCVANFDNCTAAVNIVNNDYFGAGFVGNFTPSGSNKMVAQYTNCTASGDVFAAEPIGSFLDADATNVDGIKGGTYSYDPENVDSETGETNNVAPGYRALDNGDGTWTVFPDNGKEVVKVAFHRWNDETDAYENWRTVEVYKDVNFLNADHDNDVNYSHPVYRFKNGAADGVADGLAELNKDAGSVERPFTYWTDAADGNGEEVLTDATVITGDMNVYVAYKASFTVAYDYNGGKVEEASRSSVEVKEESYNPTVKGIPAPAQEGYILTGWKYAVDADPESEDLETSGKWYMGEVLTASTRLIAQWVKAPVEETEKEDPIPVELGTKTDELLNRNQNRYTVNIDVPGANGVTGHDEVILMVDGSYSMDNEWPAMKEAINTIGETVLNGSGTTQLTLMAFGMGDNIVLQHVKDADALAAALGELPGNLLYGRSSTNCEAGFDGVANYIKNHDNTLNDVHVIFISDGNVNTDETPRAFAQNWKSWTKFGALAVAQETFGGTVTYGENLPAAFGTVFGNRFAGVSKEEIVNRAFGGEVTDAEFLAFADQVWEDVYNYSGLHIGVKYPVSVAERAFVKYDKEMGTYIQDLFYYTTYKSAYVGYGDRWTRTPVAANELAAMEEVAAMYVVDYDGYTAWMDTGITSEKSTFVQSNGIAGLVTALEGALGELAKAPINDPVITDYMSKWVNLDATTLKIIDNNTGKVLWTVADGWAEGVTPATAKNPPVVVELVDLADYAAGGDDVIGNTSGDIYKLTWYLKDGAMLRSDDFRLSYEVTVDTKEAGFEYEKDYPANGETFIEYKDDEGNEKGNDIDVPDVNGIRVATTLSVKKVNENGKALAGAEFEVRDLNGNVVATGTSDANGELTLTLEAGDHLLVETKAPAGYLTIAKAVEITVNDNLEISVEDTNSASYDGKELTIVNRPPHAAVVLTIDMSGTMYRNKMDGKRYVDVAKAKAVEFANQYAATAANNSKRMLSVVCFDTDAKVQQHWIDVSTAAGLKTAVAAINKIKVADNGKASSNQVCTNFDAGVILSRNLLKQSVVSDIDRCFTIILSDGAPTVTVNSDTDTVGTIKSSFWGKQYDAAGKKYQNAKAGGGWTHPGEVDRALGYMQDLEELTYDYTVNGEKKEGIFIVGVGGLMNFKLFDDAVYGTSNGARTSDVKKKPAAFNNIDALEGYTQAQILNLTTGDWMNILATRVGGTYESATNTAGLQTQFTNILNAIKDTTTPAN